MQAEIELKILNPKMTDKLSTYAMPGSAGLDLCVCLGEAVILQPGDTYLVPTGLAVHLANPGYAVVLLPRSDPRHKHGTVSGSLVGPIDSEYQGKLKASVWNRGKEAFIIEPMEYVA